MDFKSCYNSPLGKIKLKSDGEFFTKTTLQKNKFSIYTNNIKETK